MGDEPVPLFCSRSFFRTSSNLAFLLMLGSLTWTPARSPVPRLEGQTQTLFTLFSTERPHSGLTAACGAEPHQMPLASGQSRPIPADSSRGDTGLSNRKWSSMSCCCSASVMFFRAGSSSTKPGTRSSSSTSTIFTFDGELLHRTALSSAAVRRQAEAADAASGPDSGAQDVVGVEVVSALRTHG
ncbi:hypothetical protein EYF80_066168 [Liparis tanakae]|uniref:Secreted protein n=1 Tax=Liparis tanakae TaxID=230148 RepID=A0A4Z2E4M8_9TELE|nr:hypothetical protein EYF80_066168 [Liparis tanakae]